MAIVDEFGFVAFFVKAYVILGGAASPSLHASANMDSFPDVVLLRISEFLAPEDSAGPIIADLPSSLRTIASISCNVR